MNGERADVGRGVASTSLSVGKPIDESWCAGAAGDADREARGDTESFIFARFSKDLKEKSHKITVNTGSKTAHVVLKPIDRGFFQASI